MNWVPQRIWTFLEPIKRQGYPDEMLLSVYRDYGVIPKDSRDDNHNRAGLDLSVYQLVEPTNVVMNKMKAWQGSIAVSQYRGIVSPDYMVLRVVREGIEPSFLHYLLRSPHMIMEYRRHAYGVRPSQWRLMYPEFRNLIVRLPPPPIQRIIADFLDRKTAAIDALIEKKERLLALLAEKRTALIHRAVTKGLDPDVPMKDSGVPWIREIPAHWNVIRLGFLAAVGNGSTPRRDNSDYWSSEGYPWLHSGKINDGVIVEADRFVTDFGLSECHLPRVPARSVLVAITGEGQTRGRAALLDIDATISQHLAYVTLRDSRLVSPFLLWMLRGYYGWLRHESSGTGSTKAALTCGFLRSMRVLCPPVDEQQRIVTHLASSMATQSAASEAISQQIDRLHEYRQALIAAVVTGQLDIQGAA